MAIIRTEELTKPLFAISDDLERPKKELVAFDDSYSRRNYIRALFASIELTIYVMKRTLLIASSSSMGELTFEEIALLREESFDLRDNDTSEPRKNSSASLII